MRILFVTPYYYPELKFGGPPKRIHALSVGLSGWGHEVRVVTFDSERMKARDRQIFDEISVQYIPWTGRAMRQIPTRLSDLRSEIGSADIVHCYGLYNLLCPAAAFLARRLTKPFVVEPMGMFTPRVRNMTLKRAYNAFFTRWMFRNAGAVVATSELEAEELRREGEGSKVVVRQNGIDLREFANLPPRDAARERWKVREGDQLVVYIGRISAKKNIQELVQAFAKLSQPNTKLLIAGPVSEPAYYRLLEDAIRDTSMNNSIQLAPAVYGEDLKSLLAAADLFVLPSLNENFGNAAGEAVAANVPVLITQTCGIAPVIHQRAGLAIPVGIEPLIEGMRKMLDPDIKDHMTASREKVKRDLSWETPLRTTEELYAAIVRR
jgi:glycosyltransferase involved in cell wall biosynthesis